MNITLITSIINTPDLPLSYIKTRSVYTKEERFEQTKNTIRSIREKIPNNKIMLMECSQLTEEEREYFKENTDIFLNIQDTNNQNLIQRMFTPSKALGEGTMTILALTYLFENKVPFQNFFKVSGRYWLNDNFEYALFDNNEITIKYINGHIENGLTSLYKLPYEATQNWIDYLINSEEDFLNCRGYENIFAQYLKLVKSKKIIEGEIGVSGNISVCGTLTHM